jgi:hypothetical protein
LTIAVLDLQSPRHHSVSTTLLYHVPSALGVFGEKKMSKELLLQHQEHANPFQNEQEKEEENKRIIDENIEQ